MTYYKTIKDHPGYTKAKHEQIMQLDFKNLSPKAAGIAARKILEGK